MSELGAGMNGVRWAGVAREAWETGRPVLREVEGFGLALVVPDTYLAEMFANGIDLTASEMNNPDDVSVTVGPAEIGADDADRGGEGWEGCDGRSCTILHVTSAQGAHLRTLGVTP